MGEVRVPCNACGQDLPVPCDRCGVGSAVRHRMRRPVEHGNYVTEDWCTACYGRWLQLREMQEFEDTVLLPGRQGRAGIEGADRG